MAQKEITTKDDIVLLVDDFYEQVLQDEIIGHFFTEVAKIDVKKHMPIMHSFWDSLLFGTATYKGNPMIKHIALNKKHKLSESDFDRWLFLWVNTVDKYFTGNLAEQAKQKAKMLKILMQEKIKMSEQFRY